MKCPVCAWEHPSMLCPRCGFDSSRDCEKYPTLGPVGKVPAVSALRKEWEEKQLPQGPTDVEQSVIQEQPVVPAPEEMPRKKTPWVAIAACAVMLIVGILIAIGVQTHSSAWRGNLLKASNPNSYYVYNTDILTSTVQTVTFLDTLKDAPDDAVDVSQKGDGSVLLWAVKRGDYYDLYYAANGGINGRDAASKLFYQYFRLEQIDFGGNFHTDEVQDMALMFYNCHSLTALDLSSFNVSSVTNARRMFHDCKSLTELKMPSFEPSVIDDTMDMFYNCPAGDNWVPLS